MPDLEKQIAEWRRSIATASKHRPDALDEFEIHLREEIDRLIRAGTSSEQAFDLAAAKLGSATALSAEFKKLEEMRRAKWKPTTLAQWACIAIAVLVFLFLVPRIGHGRMTLLLASHVLSITIGYVMMFIIGGLAICYVLAEWFNRTGPSQRYALRRTVLRLATISAVLTSIGIVLGMVWAKQNMGRYWDWDPKETGGAVVLLSAVMTGALGWLKPTSYNGLIIMGILGNIATAWGWFGVNAGTHSNPLLLVFIVAHCLLLATFFATTQMKRRELAGTPEP